MRLSSPFAMPRYGTAPSLKDLRHTLFRAYPFRPFAFPSFPYGIPFPFPFPSLPFPRLPYRYPFPLSPFLPFLPRLAVSVSLSLPFLPSPP